MKWMKMTLTTLSLFIFSFAMTSCGIGNPVGTWRQDVAVDGHATLRYCIYTFNEDNTFDYLDHKEYDYVDRPLVEDTGGGTWAQSGLRVETDAHLEALGRYWHHRFLDRSQQTYWTISGDELTIGHCRHISHLII
jgi:hypothetical protein